MSPPTFPRPSAFAAEGANVLLDDILASNIRPELSHKPVLDLLVCVVEKLSTHGELDRGNAALLQKLVEENIAAQSGGWDGGSGGARGSIPAASSAGKTGLRHSGLGDQTFPARPARSARDEQTRMGAMMVEMGGGPAGNGVAAAVSGMRALSRRDGTQGMPGLD
jgi:hypothetical protein